MLARASNSEAHQQAAPDTDRPPLPCPTASTSAVLCGLSFRGLFWKAARVGERLSAWVSLSLISMALYLLLWQK